MLAEKEANALIDAAQRVFGVNVRRRSGWGADRLVKRCLCDILYEDGRTLEGAGRLLGITHATVLYHRRMLIEDMESSPEAAEAYSLIRGLYAAIVKQSRTEKENGKDE